VALSAVHDEAAPVTKLVTGAEQSLTFAVQVLRSLGGAIALGCIVVVLGCIWGVASLQLGRRSRNWLYFVETAGSILVVAGIVGQRVFPSDDAVRRLGSEAAAAANPGLWEAKFLVPGIGVDVDSVTAFGCIALAAGVALLLFFESAQQPTSAPIDEFAPLDVDDAE
jgi:hypothetical protein